MNTRIRSVLLGALIVFALMQTVQPDRSNPPVTGSLAVNPEVGVILRRSCFDCHSNETRWPVYSYVAPASWLIAGHVKEGRQALNFSEWEEYDERERMNLFFSIAQVVRDAEMPLRSYILLHGDAVLSEADAALLIEWAEIGE